MARLKTLSASLFLLALSRLKFMQVCPDMLRPHTSAVTPRNITSRVCFMTKRELAWYC